MDNQQQSQQDIPKLKALHLLDKNVTIKITTKGGFLQKFTGKLYYFSEKVIILKSSLKSTDKIDILKDSFNNANYKNNEEYYFINAQNYEDLDIEIDQGEQQDVKQQVVQEKQQLQRGNQKTIHERVKSQGSNSSHQQEYDADLMRNSNCQDITSQDLQEKHSLKLKLKLQQEQLKPSEVLSLILQ